MHIETKDRLCDVCNDRYTPSKPILEIDTSDSRFSVDISYEERERGYSQGVPFVSIEWKPVDLCPKDRLRVLEAAVARIREAVAV